MPREIRRDGQGPRRILAELRGMWKPRIGRMVGRRCRQRCSTRSAWSLPLEELLRETREVVHPILRHQD